MRDEVKHELQGFSSNILKKVKAFQKEKGRFYVHSLKRDKDVFIYDQNKKMGKPSGCI